MTELRDRAPQDVQDAETTYEISNGALVAPFFYAGKLYYLSTGPRDVPAIYHADLETSGKILQPVRKLALSCANPVAHGSAVVFNSKVYLFYSEDLGNYRYAIKYKTSTAPETSWSPAKDGLATGAQGEWAGWPGHAYKVKFKALSLNNKLFLFYWRSHAIYYKTFDGSAWSAEKTVTHWNGSGAAIPYHPWFDATVVNFENTSLIFLAAATKDDEKNLTGVWIDSKGNVQQSYRVYLDWVQFNNFFSFLQGSTRWTAQSNVLQIFGCGSYYTNPYRRIEIDLRAGSLGKWVDVSGNKDNQFRVTDAVSAAIPDKKDGSFRQVIVYHGHQHHENEVTFYSYLSDYYAVVRTSPEVNTGSDATLEPEAWTLLGVVEGPPPFTRNGSTSKEATAIVTYGQSEDKKISTKVQFGFSASISGSLGSSTTGVGGELTASMARDNEIVHTFSKTSKMILDNMNDNADGRYGWFVICKPVLQSRTYARLPGGYIPGHTKELMRIVMIQVTDVAITFEPFELANPPAGMAKRYPTSKLRKWQENAFPGFKDGIVAVHKADTLKASLMGGSSSVGLQITKSEMASETQAVGFKIKSAAGQEQLFGFSIENGMSFQHAVSQETTVSNLVTAELRLVRPPAEGVEAVTELTVIPAWLVPRENATLKDFEQRPYWIPTAYADAQIVPWCITWRVDSIKTEVYSKDDLPDMLE